jgi:hypothetical protein
MATGLQGISGRIKTGMAKAAKRRFSGMAPEKKKNEGEASDVIGR